MTPSARAIPDVDYVLPLRWTDDSGLDELTSYLTGLASVVHPIVVDGSPDAVFAAHARAWANLGVTHLRPQVECANGKVAGVRTGMIRAGGRVVVIADDDVRYDAATLAELVAHTRDADLVGPQNVLRPVPWHALWDTSRTLLNRALGADYPGTFAVRRSTFLAMGGYDGDVLFENLELMRTVAAFGGVVRRPLDLYVTRLPPTWRHFRRQRVRQAYDDLAQPLRLTVELAILPALAAGLSRRPWLVGVAAVAATALAERGRRRAGGAVHFPWRASAFAPLWVLERGTCVWLAVAWRLARGGIPYAGGRLRVAANPGRTLRARLDADRWRGGTGRPPAHAVAGGEVGGDVRAVAERLAGGPPAPAERDGAPAGVDLGAVVVEVDDVAAHDQRTVAVGGDGHLIHLDRAEP